MTVIGAINHIDALKPNTYSQTEKVRWLSTLDGLVKAEIIDTHEGGVEFNGYDENSLTQELLIPHPYDDVYVKWLEAQIDYANGEYGKYNNSITMYNSAYTSFANHYNRTHMPKSKAITNW